MKKKAALFWSGGKDSAFALYNVQMYYPELEVRCLITTLNTKYNRISMHGVREELLDRQAKATGIPLQKMWVSDEPSNSVYEKVLHETLSQLKSSGIGYIIYGDIFLEDLKQYRENILKEHSLTGVFPLWKKETSRLVHDFISLGFRTVICCISTAYLDRSWLGKQIDSDFIRELPPAVDPCGENGEFHTFCFQGPVFNSAISFNTGEERFSAFSTGTSETKNEEGFWYIDLREESKE